MKGILVASIAVRAAGERLMNRPAVPCWHVAAPWPSLEAYLMRIILRKLSRPGPSLRR